MENSNNDNYHYYRGNDEHTSGNSLGSRNSDGVKNAGSRQSAGSGRISGTGQNSGSGRNNGTGQSSGSGRISGTGQNSGSGRNNGTGQSSGSGRNNGARQGSGNGGNNGGGNHSGTGSSPKKSSKSAGKKKLLNRILLLIQTVVSIIFLILAFSYLPLLYTIAAILALYLMLYVCYKLMYRKKHPKSRTFGRVLSGVLSFALLIGSTWINSGTNALNLITSGGDTETAEVSVVVLKSSGIDDIKDVTGTIAWNRSYDDEISADILKLIQEDTGSEPVTDNFSQFAYLGNALYAGSVEAIFFNEAYRDFLDEEFETFDDDTKVIATYKVETGNTLAASAVDDVTKDCFIMYVSGIDTRTEELTAASRSDANCLIVVNPNTSQVLLLGIPRDYYINIPYEGKKDKLTHSGNYGVNATIEALEELFDGVEINYYVRINFAATISIIDAMDGVDVYSPIAFSTLDDQYEIAEGTNHMDGRMALYFMRTRYGLKGGDNDRVTNQTRVIRAVMKKVTSFSSVSNYNKILKAASKAAKTNMSTSEINSLIRYQIGSGTDWDIQNYQLTGDSSGFNSKGQSIMVPDEDSVEKAIGLLNSMLNNETIDLEKVE